MVQVGLKTTLSYLHVGPMTCHHARETVDQIITLRLGSKSFVSLIVRESSDRSPAEKKTERLVVELNNQV